MGKSSAPPVDYAAQAKAQADANKDASYYNNNANRVDQYSPLGSSTWTLRPGADPKNPQPGDYIQTIALTPEQQQLYSSGLAGQQTLTQGINTAAQRAVDAMGQPISTAGLPALQGAPGIVQTAQAGQGINLGHGLTGSVDTSGMAPLTNDFSADRDRVVQAIMARQAPDLAFSREQLDTSLANKGIDLGSTAYARAQDLQARKENDAALQAYLAGGQEQSRLQNLALQTNAQQFNQGLANQNLGLATAGFQNAAQGQLFGQQSTQDQTINALLARNATFGNQARQQGISEEAYLRSLPLNEFNALRGGTAVQQPTFPSFYTSNAGSAPVMDAALAQDKQNQFNAAQSNASSNATMGAIAAIIAAMMSDKRLKTNIKTVGEHPSGVRRVSWDWKEGGGGGVGVVAQELEKVRPDAVFTLPGGIKIVNYAAIGGH